MKYEDLGILDDSDGVLLECSKMDSIEEIRKTLLPFYENLVQYYENDLLLLDSDFRSGEQVYSYTNLESIKGSLSYISDRWCATFRVRWLINLINPEYILYQGQLNQIKQK